MNTQAFSSASRFSLLRLQLLNPFLALYVPKRKTAYLISSMEHLAEWKRTRGFVPSPSAAGHGKTCRPSLASCPPLLVEWNAKTHIVNLWFSIRKTVYLRSNLVQLQIYSVYFMVYKVGSLKWFERRGDSNSNTRPRAYRHVCVGSNINTILKVASPLPIDTIIC